MLSTEDTNQDSNLKDRLMLSTEESIRSGAILNNGFNKLYIPIVCKNINIKNKQGLIHYDLGYLV